jgi:serine/threonine protein kinase
VPTSSQHIELPPGISKKYRAIRVLGVGGFGTVYEAVQEGLERTVALKVLSDKAFADQDAVGRFIHEAHVASRISHPNVVSLLDFGVDGEVGYIAFPLVEGCTLRDKIRLGPMATGPAMLIGIGLADALAEIHRQGVIHRDLKPENVLLDEKGRPMLTDFGISKSAESAVKTREGIIFGTPGYVAPEQLEQERASPLSDQFSLGVIIFEVLSGRRPYAGDTPAEEAMARIKQPPMHIRSLLPKIDSGVASVVMLMLARKPEDRYKDLRSVHRALQLAAVKLPMEDPEDLSLPGQQLPLLSSRRMAVVPAPAAGESLDLGAHDTPVLKSSSRISRVNQTAAIARSGLSKVSPWPAALTRQRLALAGGCAALAVFGGCCLWWRSGPPEPAEPAKPPVVASQPPGGPSTAPEETRNGAAQVPAAVARSAAPVSFRRLIFPDCARLGTTEEGTQETLDAKRCKVRRWLESWRETCGHPVPGDFVLAVRERRSPAAALPMLELFESAPAMEAATALASLREAGELGEPERVDAGLLLLKKHTGHAAWVWKAFGSGLAQDAQFTFPKLFHVAVSEFYPDWNHLWQVARTATWEDRAAALSEWVSFHRALDEERVAWSKEAPRHNALGELMSVDLAREDPGFALTRLWRLRLQGQFRLAMPLWKRASERLERASPSMQEGERLTMRAWMAFEGCLLGLAVRDLGMALRLSTHGKKLMGQCEADPGARTLGLAAWPEWPQVESVGR